MPSPQVSFRIPLELDERLQNYMTQTGMTKSDVMVNALAHYLGCGNEIPLPTRMTELEQRVKALEALMLCRDFAK